jgi:glycosyltransferase involved in cell wall biosynthesis
MSSSDSASVLLPERLAKQDDDRRRRRSGLRVVFLSDALEERNGAGTYYHDLVDHLRERVACVELFCPAGGSKTRYEYLALPLPGDPTQQLRLPRFGWLSRAVREAAPDVIVAATPGPYGFFACLLSKRWRVPLCAGHHTRFDRLVELYWRGRLGRLTARCVASIHGLLFRASAVVMVTSPEMARHARGVGAKRVCLVQTPIGKRFLDEPVPPPPSQLESVLYAGRLASEKNTEAVAEAAETLPHIRFVIAGDGPQRAFVEQKAQQLANLDYVGWIPREKVVPWFDRSDMLVLQSRVESFGTVALEAMARRRLVLVSPHCGILDWQSLSRAVLRMEDHETLAESVRRVERWDSQSRIAKAEMGHRAVQSLNAETVERWLDVLDRLARRRQKRRDAAKRRRKRKAVGSC